MSTALPGLHHVTAIAGDPQTNVDFYAGKLGMRFVKRTVNFDDPGTYHFYYGDADASPGSILTFFPWPGAPRGRHGTGQTSATAFAVPGRSIGWWMRHLRGHGVETRGPEGRFGEEVVTFQDPDGLSLELVGVARDDSRRPWEGGAIPVEHAIRGFHGVTLMEEAVERTAGLLTATLGFHPAGEKGNRFRFVTGDVSPGGYVDLRCEPLEPRGIVAVGTVHHVAWRAPDDSAQEAWRTAVARLGVHVTPIVDRCYFRSIYFREPGGVLFEIATDTPGFAIDEPADRLGATLRLPPWLEQNREEIERLLPSVRIPA